MDRPVTPEERLADALSSFNLTCDRAIEALETFRCDPPFTARGGEVPRDGEGGVAP